MGYFKWYYTEGFRFYLKRWICSIKFLNHFFSLPLLLDTLFSPWKRLEAGSSGPGFDLQLYMENITFNLISRGIGAVVRIFLFWTGALSIFLLIIGGLVGIPVWLMFPIFGIQIYSKYINGMDKYLGRMKSDASEGKIALNEIIFNKEVGIFMANHLGLDYTELLKNTNITENPFEKKSYNKFSELVNELAGSKVWSDNFLNSKTISTQDIVLASSWWEKEKERGLKVEGDGFGRPGIGLDLLFGYTPNLSQCSIDLSIPHSFSHRLIGRDEVVDRMERVLTGGKSIVLVGFPGVGKKTTVIEFAERAITGKMGPEMVFRRVMEFDYNFLLAESVDLNRKKAKLSQIFSEAVSAGNVILMIRDLQRLINPEVEGYDFTDVFEEFMEKKQLKIIAISTPVDFERFIAPNIRIRKFFERVDLEPTSKELAFEIMVEAAINWEKQEKFLITIPALRKILDGSDKYITETPFPEKALELMDAIISYKKQRGGFEVTVEDANIVLAEKTGLSFSALTEVDKQRLSNLESLIHERLVNQDVAVNLIAKSLRGRTIGVSKENKPIGAFMFLGPTGVGKTETAKVLAKVYYGSEDAIIRFDMAEYAGREGLERLIGSVSRNRPGVMTTAIKNKPASLLLLDEFEKATPDIFNLFLTLLDEGYITDAFGNRISARHLFVIATSNAGAEFIRGLVSEGTMGEELQKRVVNYVLEKGLFSPEFFNRFDGVVVYEPLKTGHLIEIAKHQLEDMQSSLKKRGIELQVSDDLVKKLAQDGYDPAYGARPMRRIIDLVLGDLVSKAILDGSVKSGNNIIINPGVRPQEYFLEKIS